MVPDVMVPALPEVQACVGPEANLAGDLIESSLARNEAAVHGVVSHDEEPSVQKTSQENVSSDQQWVKLLAGKVETRDQGEQPGGPNQARQSQSLPMVVAD